MWSNELRKEERNVKNLKENTWGGCDTGKGPQQVWANTWCMLGTSCGKNFLPVRVRCQDPLFHHRFMEREASFALASLAYRSSNSFKLTRQERGKLVYVSHSSIPHSSSPQTLRSPSSRLATSKHHSLASGLPGEGLRLWWPIKSSKASCTMYFHTWMGLAIPRGELSIPTPASSHLLGH